MQARTYLAIGCWGVLAIALAQQQQQTHPLTRRTIKPLTKEETITSIQTGVQAALDDLTMTKLQTVVSKDQNGHTVTYKVEPTFGLRRTPTMSIIHDGVMRDTNVPIPFGDTLRGVQYYAVSRMGQPLMSHKMMIHKDFGVFVYSLSDNEARQVVGFADHALSSLQTKDVYLGTVDGKEAQARPIRLSKPECLPCHQDSKLRDPLAILVYVMKKPST